MTEEVKPEIRVKEWWTRAHTEPACCTSEFGQPCAHKRSADPFAVYANAERPQRGTVTEYKFTEGVRHGMGYVVLFGTHPTQGRHLMVETQPSGAVLVTEYDVYYEGWYQFRCRAAVMGDDPATYGPRLALMCDHTGGEWRDV